MDPTTATAFSGRALRILIPGLWLAAVFCPPAGAGPPAADLQDRYLALQDRFEHNAFQRPLFLESTEGADELKGEIYAVVDQPFSTVSPVLQVIDHWCDILILHLNVKGCRVGGSPGAQTLQVSLGRKFDEPLDQTHPVTFDYRVAAAGAGYLQIRLHADTGPLGSRDYQIALEAVPLTAGRTFIHLSYSYSYGLSVQLAMKGYLATLGSGKVGFSVTGRRPDGEAVLIDGVRAVVERNTMRYYLAIESYLGSLSAPPAEQLEQRLHDWYTATERFPRQLHELGKDEYLAMKHREVLRQQADPARPNG